jgi:hypothetical protein
LSIVGENGAVEALRDGDDAKAHDCDCEAEQDPPLALEQSGHARLWIEAIRHRPCGRVGTIDHAGELLLMRSPGLLSIYG